MILYRLLLLALLAVGLLPLLISFSSLVGALVSGALAVLGLVAAYLGSDTPLYFYAVARLATLLVYALVSAPAGDLVTLMLTAFVAAIALTSCAPPLTK